MGESLKNVLVVTDVNFWVKGAGHRMRISSLVEYLSSRVNLTIAFAGPMDRVNEQFVSDTFKTKIHVLERKKILSSSGYGRRLATWLNDHPFDTIIIEYIHNTYFLNFIADGVQVILDAHDIVSNRTEQFKAFNSGGDIFEMERETEFKIFDVYDYVMVLCMPDYNEIIASIGTGKVLLCPHHVSPARPEIRKEVRTIGFIASEYPPNIDAIRFFIEHCWPAIYQKHRISLAIYGGINNVIDLPYVEGIVAKGYVPDLKSIYEETDIVINPVRFGAGLKIKNVEALSFGVPLVTSAHGARGLEQGKDTAFLTAADAAGFKSAIILLIENYQVREALSREALKFIEKYFSADECYGPLLKIIEQQDKNNPIEI